MSTTKLLPECVSGKAQGDRITTLDASQKNDLSNDERHKLVKKSHNASSTLPVNVMMEHIVRFVDRGTYNRVSVMHKELHHGLRLVAGANDAPDDHSHNRKKIIVDNYHWRHIISPPWPLTTSFQVDDHGSILVCDFSPIMDGRLLACGTNKGTIYLWNKITGAFTKLLQSTTSHYKQPAPLPQRNHYFVTNIGGRPTRAIQMMKFTPNGRYLVTTGKSHRGNIDIWDVRRLYSSATDVYSDREDRRPSTKSQPSSPPLPFYTTSKTLSGHVARVHSVAFTNDSKIMISTSFDGTIRYWNIENGSCIHVQSIFPLPSNNHGSACNILTMAMSVVEVPNENFISRDFPQNWSSQLSSSHKNTADTCLRVHVGYADINDPNVVQVQTFTTSTSSVSVRISSFSFFTVRGVECNMKMIRSISFSPDGKYLVTADIASILRCWEIGGTVQRSHELCRSTNHLPVLLWKKACPGGIHDISFFETVFPSTEMGGREIQGHFDHEGGKFAIATGGDEGSVRFWRAHDGCRIANNGSARLIPGTKHEEDVNHGRTSSPNAIRSIATCSGSGCRTTLASGSLNGSIRFWGA